MSYRDRIQAEVHLTSPDGNDYWPRFRGDPITARKRIAQFNYPGIDGTVIQDLGLDGFLWPLTLYFDEDHDDGNFDHDLTAKAFLDNIAVRGTDGRSVWTVVHPVYGVHYLQILEAELVANPVDSDGLTVIETKWIEPQTQTNTPSASELAGSAQSAINSGANISTAAAASANVVQNTQDQIAAFRNACQQSQALVQKYINNADSVVNLIESGITAAYQGTVSVLGMVGQVQQLFQSPNLLLGDVSSKVKSLSTIGAAVLGIAPTSGNTQSTKNQASVAEVYGNAVLGAMVMTATTGTYTSRPQIIETINSLNAYYAALTTGLDNVQALFAGTALAGQYFSQSKSFSDGLRAIQLTIAYLLAVLFSTSVVKTYTLTADTTTIAEAIRAYASKGAWQDSYWDLFVQTNHLYGNLLWVLPRGFKVQVFA